MKIARLKTGSSIHLNSCKVRLLSKFAWGAGSASTCDSNSFSSNEGAKPGLSGLNERLCARSRYNFTDRARLVTAQAANFPPEKQAGISRQVTLCHSNHILLQFVSSRLARKPPDRPKRRYLIVIEAEGD
jgi:hypothetical protein